MGPVQASWDGTYSTQTWSNCAWRHYNFDPFDNNSQDLGGAGVGGYMYPAAPAAAPWQYVALTTDAWDANACSSAGASWGNLCPHQP